MLQEQECVTHDMDKGQSMLSHFWVLGFFFFLRYKRISSRNTSFSIHVLKEKLFSCIDIVSLVFLTFHCMASCAWLYKHHDDSSHQSVLVGVPCSPSSFNLANVESVAFGECSRNV